MFSTGTINDLSKRCVSMEEGQLLKKQMSAAEYVECSTKCMAGIEKVFQIALMNAFIRKKTRHKKCNIIWYWVVNKAYAYALLI